MSYDSDAVVELIDGVLRSAVADPRMVPWARDKLLSALADAGLAVGRATSLDMACPSCGVVSTLPPILPAQPEAVCKTCGGTSIVPDGAHYSGLGKDYGGRYCPDCTGEDI